MKHLRYIAATTLLFTLLACSRQVEYDPEEEILDEKYMHKYGVAVPPDFWQTSGEDGAVVSTLANGVVVSKSYKSGVLDGETTYSFPNSSQIQKREFYNQGNLVKIREQNIEGSPRNEVSYNSPEQGYVTSSSWYSNGAPKNVERMHGDLLLSGEYYNPNNQLDSTVENGNGTRIMRDEFGQLLATDTIQDGKMTERLTLHPNNAPKEKIPYNQNNEVHGCKPSFHPGGEPDTIEYWNNGQQDGVTTVFFNGEKYAEIPYVKGAKTGIERRYRDGIDLVQEISWKNDKLDGPSITYAGDASKTEWYFQGTPTTEANYRFMTRRPIVK